MGLDNYIATSARRRFTEEENYTIIDWYDDETVSVEEIAENLGRTVPSITSQAKRLRAKGLLSNWKAGSGEPWTESQITHLSMWWGIKPDDELAEKVNHTVKACSRKATELGIRKSENRIESDGIVTCRRGHLMTPANTIIRENSKTCRTCRNNWAKKNFHTKVR